MEMTTPQSIVAMLLIQSVWGIAYAWLLETDRGKYIAETETEKSVVVGVSGTLAIFSMFALTNNLSMPQVIFSAWASFGASSLGIIARSVNNRRLSGDEPQ